MNVESQIIKYEQEIKALKASYEQSAAEMPMFSTQMTFNTSMNTVKYTYPPGIDPLQWSAIIAMPRINLNTACGEEPIVVTFNCDEGINTFASLEIEKISGVVGVFGINVHKIIYNGGARWLVTVQPNVYLQDSWYVWSPTVLRFVVKSAAKGTLGAKMIWQ